ncbi:molybdopterin-dependent oxidoreductase [Mucilaginibacter sp.]|jgi:DMSO/TMAO reductase YedYZ molybdopterin-dependent catalytic subunit|uniref:molybdopterin-dependent oxidoreductase n=1 Tax=Mucilaginibacter sp. TaxID=1882438 RepID=UPI002CE58F0A|nr:molybdopterin-dependent oxidoreductase [Mucilaginibacter sp.]HTI57404.1 molybdopterin-dependent oxidoreductase [Mucilaginibacter sp.]
MGKRLINRRKAIYAGLTSVGGMLLTGCFKKPLPPTYGNILCMGDAFTYIAQRTLLPGQSLAKEYQKSDISSFPATGTINPANPEIKFSYNKHYHALQQNNFKDFVLSVEGKVSKPGKYSIDDLKKLGQRTQITRHTCEEGWNAIAEWSGVPLSAVLQHAGILPAACCVSLYGYDNYAESIDMLDAFHPQTILAHSMNGEDLPVQHGAPLRLRVETQIGYKSVKYVHRIVVTDKFVDANGDIQAGWSWYTGI